VIPNRFDFIFVFDVIDRRGLGRSTTRKQLGIIVDCRFEALGMDGWVDLVFCWQIECVGGSRWFGLGDFEGTDEARVKFGDSSFLLDAKP
jgi:hypothetical protein